MPEVDVVRLTPLRVLGLLAAVAFLASAATIALREWADRPSATDVGFLQDMIAHHENAVEMSLAVAEADMPTPVPGFAREVVIFQQYEIGLMEATLRRWGHGRTGDGTAMEWMGDGRPVEEMPGMASEEQLDQLDDAEGREAAERWIALMTRHHRAGAEMAEALVEQGDDEQVRELAARIAEVQPMEIAEYAGAADRLGLEVPADLAELPADEHGHD